MVAARWGLQALVSLAPGDIPGLEEAGVNPTALAFAATSQTPYGRDQR